MKPAQHTTQSDFILCGENHNNRIKPTSRIQTNAPPLAWLQRHSAEGGVSCAELERREAVAGEKLSMTSYGMTLAEASAIARNAFECSWTRRDSGSLVHYKTSCGRDFNGHQTVKEAGITFCGYCGNPIKEEEGE